MSKLSEINNKLLNFSILNNADRILTVSNTVKKEIDKYYSYPEEKIFVVYNTFSLNKNILIDETSILNKFNILNENYVLSVSSMNPNKNLKSLIDSFNIINKSHPNLKLVLIGGKTSSIEKLKKLTANSNIIFTGYINDEELKVLYKNAKLYAFPSIYEGFGIPIIDAQLFEIPVLCSDIPVFREVAQNSVEYFQPDSESIANKICSLISSNDRCQELINFGVQNIKRFTLKQIYIQLKEILNIEEKYGCNDSICKL